MDFELNPKDEQTNAKLKKKTPASVILATTSLILCVILIFSLVLTVLYFSEQNRSLEEDYRYLYQSLGSNRNETTSENTDSSETEQTTDDGKSSNLSTENSDRTPAVLDEKSYELASVVSTVRASVVCVFVTVPSQTVDYGFAQFQTQAATSSGSGVIWSQDGYIITNQHVVEAAQQYANAFITILLDDGTELDATLIAADKQTDLALLKVDTDKNLTPISVGTSSNLLVGQTAIAIGNPLGVEYANSVTVGIVSGLNRQVTGENGVSTMIQTDAAVNPGNSGGALVDASGKLIGVVSAKISSTEVEGIGFAIPIDDALNILSSLKEYGYVKGRPATGIASGTEITASMSRRYRLPQGLYVNEITRNSAAEEAGLQKYDIILSVDGQDVTTLDEIEAIKKERSVGDSLKIVFYRSGKTYETTLILTEDKG